MIYQLGDQIPQLGEDVYIAPSADVIGSVNLGRPFQCLVWCCPSRR